MGYKVNYNIVKHLDGPDVVAAPEVINRNGTVYAVHKTVTEYHSLLARIGRVVIACFMVLGTLGLILLSKQKKQDIHSYLFENVASVTKYICRYNTPQNNNVMYQMFKKSSSVAEVQRCCEELNFDINFDIDIKRYGYFGIYGNLPETRDLEVIEFFIAENKGTLASQEQVRSFLLQELIKWSFDDYSNGCRSPEELYEIAKKFIDLGVDVNFVLTDKDITILSRVINYLFYLQYKSLIKEYAPLLSLLFAHGAKTTENKIYTSGKPEEMGVERFIDTIKHQPKFLALKAGTMDENSLLSALPLDVINSIGHAMFVKI